MKFNIDSYVPLVSLDIVYKGKKSTFDNVLLDTGCSSTILDTDLCEKIGIFLDFENAITRKMFGIGGAEICIEQKVSDIKIDKFKLIEFTLQLGDVREMHGFAGIVGSDFLLANQLVIDFENMEVRQNEYRKELKN